MLTLCDEVGCNLDILFHANKSALFKVGKILKYNLQVLKLSNVNILMVNRLTLTYWACTW